jgi:hypothetical protein
MPPPKSPQSDAPESPVDAKDLPKATVKLQAPAGAPPAGPRPASVPAPKATVPLAKPPVPAKAAPAAGEAQEAPVRAATSEASFGVDESEEVAQESAAGGLDKWLAIAASIVALLSTVSTFLAYSAVK